MYDLTRKIALVTGIGGPVDALGNGKAIAMLLAKQGAIIEGTDVDEVAGANTVAAIRDAGGMAHCSRVDATDQTGVEDWVKACAAKHGKIDILVNNVGQSEPGGPVSMDAATWQAQIVLNLDSVFYTMQAVLPHMVAAKAGSIINISSICGLVGSFGNAAYHASKGAVRIFTKATAVQHAKDNIRSNSIHPGFVDTPMTAPGHSNNEVAKVRIEATPLGRFGVPKDIAMGCLYLASDESSWITGTELVIDGGLTAH